MIIEVVNALFEVKPPLLQTADSTPETPKATVTPHAPTSGAATTANPTVAQSTSIGEAAPTIDVFGTKFFPMWPAGGRSVDMHQDSYYFGSTASEHVISFGIYLEGMLWPVCSVLSTHSTCQHGTARPAFQPISVVLLRSCVCMRVCLQWMAPNVTMPCHAGLLCPTETDVENGCFRVVPGTHNIGKEFLHTPGEGVRVHDP